MDEWNEMYENVVYVDGMQKFKKFYDSREWSRDGSQGF